MADSGGGDGSGIKAALASSLPWEGPPHCWSGVRAWSGPGGGGGEVGVGGRGVQAMGGGDGGGPGSAGEAVQS